MAFAKIAKRNNKNTIEPTYSRHSVTTNATVRDKDIPFPYKAAIKSEYRQTHIKHWLSTKYPYKVLSM